MDSQAVSDGQKSMSFLTEINRIYWCVIWTRCGGSLAGNCAVGKTLTGISTVSILTTVTFWIEISECVLLLVCVGACILCRPPIKQYCLFMWKDGASSIILPWKPHLGNPPLPLPVAALSNDAQIDTLAPPPFLPLFSLRLCKGAKRTAPPTSSLGFLLASEYTRLMR